MQIIAPSLLQDLAMVLSGLDDSISSEVLKLVPVEPRVGTPLALLVDLRGTSSIDAPRDIGVVQVGEVEVCIDD